MSNDNANFATVINQAGLRPDDGEGATADLPQLFNFPIPEGESVVDNEPVPDARRIKGVPAYKLRAHFKRFIIGTIVMQLGRNEEAIVNEHDDTAEYEEIQNLCLQGKAIMCWEKPNFLKDGTVVIAMKWMTKHDPKDYADKYGEDADE